MKRGDSFEFKTGRVYDTEQVLAITFVDYDVDGDPYFKVVDASRNMTIFVETFMIDTSLPIEHMGEYMQYAYDNGQYHLDEWSIVRKHLT